MRGWYYVMHCTCMILRLLKNGVIMAYVTKCQLCLYEAYDEELSYYDYDIFMLINYVLYLFAVV